MAVVGVATSACSGGAAAPTPTSSTNLTSTSTTPGTTTPAVTSPSSASVTPSTSASPSESATSTPTKTGTGRTATIAVNGDMLWHNTTWKAAKVDANRAGDYGADAYDFVPTLKPIQPFIESADLALCHNDIPTAPKGGPYYNYPTFSLPPQSVAALKPIGYDMCTTGSNHMLDQGFAGLVRTLDALDQYGLKNAGAARTPAEADEIPIWTTKSGVKIAVLSGTYSTNGIPLPQGKEWCLKMLEPTSVHLERARKAKAMGADIVIAVMQAGDEYVLLPNEQQKRTAAELTAGDIDVVINQHSHVVNPWTKINGKWVIYGLGNAVSQQKSPENYDGVIARLTFTEQPDGTFTVTTPEYVPTMMTRWNGGPIRLYPVVSTIAAGGTPYASVAQLKASLDRTTKRVMALGATGLVLR